MNEFSITPLSLIHILRYYAAFAGCSAETEASFEIVSFLAKKVDELGLPCVLTIEGKNHKLAETIVRSTAGKNQKVLTMDLSLIHI